MTSMATYTRRLRAELLARVYAALLGGAHADRPPARRKRWANPALNLCQTQLDLDHDVPSATAAGSGAPAASRGGCDRKLAFASTIYPRVTAHFTRRLLA